MMLKDHMGSNVDDFGSSSVTSTSAKCHTQIQDTSSGDIAKTTLRADFAPGRFCPRRF
jgi:hypothetical protein